MSEESVFDKAIEEQEADLNQRNRAVRRRNMLILGLAVAAVIFAVVCLFLAMDNQRLAVANAVYGATQAQEKQQLAQEASDTLCQAPAEKSAAEAQACRNIADAASAPTSGPQGAQGVQGAAGVPGPAGQDGAPGAPGVPGPPGPKGDNGANGSSGTPGIAGASGTDGASGSQGPPGPPGPVGPPGPAGATGSTGANGADSTVPGPAGADGAQGPQGPQGDPGRGVDNAYCGEDGKWTITYTDGATSDGGICRATFIPPGANP